MSIQMNNPKKTSKESVKKILTTTPEQARFSEVLDVLRFISANSKVIYAEHDKKVKEIHKDCMFCVDSNKVSEIRRVVNLFDEKECDIDIKPTETLKTLNLFVKFSFADTIKFTKEELAIFSKLYTDIFEDTYFSQNSKEGKIYISTTIKKVGTYKRKDGKELKW